MLAASLFGTPLEHTEHKENPRTTEGAHSFQSNDATIRYEIRGSGKPLFMLHGGLTSREDLRLQIDHFSQSYQVVAVDSREHGFSGNSPLQISYKLMASDVANLATHLGFKEITVMGQSDGGITALTFAHLYPKRASHLILLGTLFNHSVVPEATKEFLRNAKWAFPLNKSAFPGVYLGDYLKGGRGMADYQKWYDELAVMWTTSPNFSASDLAQISVPALIINGDTDDVDLAHTLELYQALPNADLFIVPGATHFLHLEKPDILHLAIEQFLAKNCK